MKNFFNSMIRKKLLFPLAMSMLLGLLLCVTACREKEPDMPTDSIESCSEHLFGEWEHLQEPTCAAPGSQRRVCMRCGFSEKEELPKTTEHTPIILPAEEASCAKKGRTEGSECAVCGRILVKQTDLPMLSHSFVNGSCEVCKCSLTSLFTYELSMDSSSYSITGVKGRLPEDVTLPTSYNGKPVSRIASCAIENCDTIKSLTIPEGIQRSAGCIFNCPNLKTVTIPTGGSSTYNSQVASMFYDEKTRNGIQSITVTGAYIGEHAFSNMKGLEEIFLSAKVKQIGYGLFFNCPKLRSITVDESNPYYYAKDNCLIERETKWLIAGCNTSVIPSDGSVIAIGNWAFPGCNFTELVIPECITVIGTGAFEGCSSLKKITLPFLGSSADTAWSSGFLGHIFGAYNVDQSPQHVPKSLKEVVVNSESVAYNALAYCENIETVIFGDKVKKIDGVTFWGCRSLKTVHFGKSVESFGTSGYSAGVFVGAPANIKITVSSEHPDFYVHNNVIIQRSTGTLVLGTPQAVIPTDGSVTAIGQNALVGLQCETLTLPACIVSIGDYAFYASETLKSVKMPGVAIIGKGAFSECFALNNIEAGDALTTISDHAFYNCSALSTFSACPNLKIIEDSAFHNCSALSAFPLCPNLKAIGENVFYNCRALESFTAGNALESIGTATFQGCTALKTVLLGHALSVIPDELFVSCSSLESVTLGNSVQTFGIEVFKNCPALTFLSLPDSVTEINSRTFSYSSVSVISVGKELPAEMFCHFPRKTELQISSENPFVSYQNGYIVDLKTRTIVWGSDLQILKITEDDNIKAIGPSAFANCTRMYVVELSGNLTHIGNNSFYGCKKLSELKLPSTLQSIGAGAFGACSSLTEVTVPNSVLEIGERAFGDCSSLNKISLPFIGSSLQSDEDFSYIVHQYSSVGANVPPSLKTVVITGAITEVKASAFKGCRFFETIILPDSVTSIGESAFYGCDALNHFIIPPSLKEIANYAFYGCEKLSEITIPESVTSIGSYAFEYCFALRTCYMPTSVKSIGYQAFYTGREITFIYSGTMSEWNAILKDPNWDKNPSMSTTNQKTTVRCTDGTI